MNSISHRQSRRTFLLGMAGSAGAAWAQGVIPRRAPTQGRGKPSGIPFTASFVDVGTPAGFNEPVIYGPADHKTYVLETLGCGCAFFDYDNDGWLDVLMLSGTRLDAEPLTASNRLYKNNRDGTFTDVTAKAGLTKTGWACGVCVGDYNNDGFEDLFITYWGQNVLYRNNGDGTFTDVTREARVTNAAGRWGTGCAFVDYNRDGFLDLFVSNYMQFDLAKAPKPGEKSTCIYKGMPVHCGPRGFPFGRHSLYRNNGDGTFTDVSEPSGIALANRSYGLTVIASDFDDDGWPDIYVACDSTPSLLFMNNHDGTFREEGGIRGVAYSEDGGEQAGMGVSVADYDLDGRLDLLKTNFADDLPNLYRNVGKGIFQDTVRDAGLSVDNRFVSWGGGICDLDNDGWPDIFIVTGHVYPELGRRFPASPLASPPLLFRSLGQGRFEELVGQAGTALSVPHVSRGCAFGDFDNDGDLDILIVNLNEPPALLRNDLSGGNHWLKVKLIGSTSNRSAIGSRVVVRAGNSTQTQELHSQSSFLSSNDPRLHFGLGKEMKAAINVRWPSGKWESTPPVDVDQLISIKEDAGIVSARKLRQS